MAGSMRWLEVMYRSTTTTIRFERLEKLEHGKPISLSLGLQANPLKHGMFWVYAHKSAARSERLAD
eukprot:1161782-Pelagomonas_calceolata.AAC.17